jgi:hypothetical protein
MQSNFRRSSLKGICRYPLFIRYFNAIVHVLPFCLLWYSKWNLAEKYRYIKKSHNQFVNSFLVSGPKVFAIILRVCADLDGPGGDAGCRVGAATLGPRRYALGSTGVPQSPLPGTSSATDLHESWYVCTFTEN